MKKLICMVGLSALMLCTTSHAMNNPSFYNVSGEIYNQNEPPEKEKDKKRMEKWRDPLREGNEKENFAQDNYWDFGQETSNMFSFSGEFLFIGDYDCHFLLLDLNQRNGETLLLRLDPNYYFFEQFQNEKTS